MTRPIVSEARTSGVRSGCLWAVIGVGTVTMKTVQSASAAGSEVKDRCAARPSSSASTSRVRSWPARSSSMRAASMSKPITGRWRPNSAASGSPT